MPVVFVCFRRIFQSDYFYALDNEMLDTRGKGIKCPLYLSTKGKTHCPPEWLFCAPFINLVERSHER